MTEPTPLVGRPFSSLATATDTDGVGLAGVRRIQSSYMQVADQLQDLILRGELITGQRLPSEAEMAPLFGVSRSTIREALRILVTNGLLVTRRGVHGGTFVATLDPARIERVLQTTFTMLALTNQVDVGDFLEAWRAIEIPAVRLAARRRDDAALRELDELSTPLNDATPRSARVEQSSSFHFALFGASGNLLLEAMGRPVSAVARSRFADTTPTQAFWRTNDTEHRRIYEAIASGDEELAAVAATQHSETLAGFYGVDAARRG